MTDAEMEKIWNNLKRNLKSYCDENGFSDVMLGLSGGLDSAIVSVLACDALGGGTRSCFDDEDGLYFGAEFADCGQDCRAERF